MEDNSFLKLSKKIEEILEKNDYLEKKVEQLTKSVDNHEFKIQELLLLLRKNNIHPTTTTTSTITTNNNSTCVGISNSPPLSPRTSTDLMTNNNSNNSSATSSTTPSPTQTSTITTTSQIDPNSLTNSNNSFIPINSPISQTTVNNNNNSNNSNNQTITSPLSTSSSNSNSNSNSSSPIVSPVSSPQLSGSGNRPRIQFLGNGRMPSTGNLFKKEDSSDSLLKYSKDSEHLYIVPTTPRPSKSPSMDFIASTSLINTVSSNNIDSTNNNDNNSILNDQQNQQQQNQQQQNQQQQQEEINFITTEDKLPNLPDSNCQWAIIWEYSANDDEWTKALIIVEIDAKPFAKGALRNAYQLKIRSNAMQCFNHFTTPIHEKYMEGKKLNLSQIPKLNQNLSLDTLYVAKDSKTSVNFNRYFEDVKMQMVCKSYGERYNSNHPPKKIEFLSAWVIEIQGTTNYRVGNRNSSNNTLYGLELFMKGEFKKQNSNFGTVFTERNTPQSFSHFTYECTTHEMVVVDIQGVDDIYTDPQVHTKDGRGYGEGNLGQKGIEKFLISHKCSPICLQFGLPPIGLETGRNAHRVIRGTMLLPDLTPDLYEPEYPLIENQPSNPLNSELTSIVHLSGHDERVCSLLINQDKTKLYSASADGYVKIWNLTNNEDLSKIQMIDSFRAHRRSIEKMLLNEKYLFTASSDGTIKIWSLPTTTTTTTSKQSSSSSSSYECIGKLEDHTAEVNDMCIDIENNFLVSCSFDKQIKIYDLSTFKCIKSLNAHGKSIKSIYMSGKYLFSSSNDQSIKIWDLEMCMCVYGMNDAHDAPITSLRMFGNRLFSASKDGEIKDWNLSTFQPTTTLDQHNMAITDILVTSNGYLFVSSDDSTIRIIDISNQNEPIKIISSTKAHRSGVNSLATDGKRIFSGGCDNLIKVWNWKNK
ncbi:hypothetical protein ACTFIW_005714 [Dictyostelium discoideum]